MAAGATVMLDQRLALGPELRIVHEVGGRVGSVRMLLREQEAGYVASVLNRQTQAGHHRHLLHDKLMTIIRASRMIEVKDKREIVLGVILGAQVLLLRWTVGARSNPWIQDPANQIIVVVLLPYSRQVRGKISANHVRAFANGMAGFATALFE